MSAYQTVVVGTDGSESSLKAVERAAALAGAADTTLVIGCAYIQSEGAGNSAADALKDEGYQVQGSAPTMEVLRKARERARPYTTKIQERAVVGAPVEALLDLVEQVDADLLVVGNKGLASLSGRLLGSVPSDVARKSRSDVLIVHTV